MILLQFSTYQRKRAVITHPRRNAPFWFPHFRYTRDCEQTPISADTVVAHCLTTKNAGDKLKWMKTMGLWLVGREQLAPLPPPPLPPPQSAVVAFPPGVDVEREEEELPP